MPPIDPHEVAAIFDEVVIVTDPHLQAKRLAERCGENAELHRRVESLLQAYTKSDFLEKPAAFIDLHGLALESNKLIGQQAGDCVLLELLGVGGMAEVYLARSEQGLVAVKLLKEGMDSKQLLARLERERHLLEQMDHPGIPKFIAAGLSDFARAYVVMELVRGLPIAEYCQRAELSIEDRLRLMVQVCQAVEYAHSQGVIHRDLKPSNILVEQQLGRSIAKVIDFGIAKTLRSDSRANANITRAEQLMGTPAYMSPEQFTWSSDATEESDVYSLGAILCELLVGSTPLDSAMEADFHSDAHSDRDVHALGQILLRTEPIRPSQILERLTNDQANEVAQHRATNLPDLLDWLQKELDWIVHKAMQPQRAERYSSAASFANDLDAVLSGRPTLARAPTWIEKIRKWSWRNSHVLKNSAIGILICAVVLTVWSIADNRVQHEHDTASITQRHGSLREQHEYHQYIADLRQAASAMRVGNDAAASVLLAKYDGPDGIDPRFDTFALRYLLNTLVVPKRHVLDHQDEVLDIDVSPDGHMMVSGDCVGNIIVRDLHDRSELARFCKAKGKEVTQARFSPDGRLLATAGQDFLVRLWCTETWSSLGILTGHWSTVTGLAWSPDSTSIAATDRSGRTIIWDINSKLAMKMLPRRKGACRAIAWSTDGQKIAVASEGLVSLWSTGDWQVLSQVETGWSALSVAFSPDGRMLAWGGYSHEMVLFDLTTLQKSQSLHFPVGVIRSIGFNEDSSLVWTAGSGQIRLYRRQDLAGPWQLVRTTKLSNFDPLECRRVAYNSNTGSVSVLLGNERHAVEIPVASWSGFEHVQCDEPVLCQLSTPGLQVIRRATDGQCVLRKLSSSLPGKESTVSELPLPIQPDLFSRPEYCPSRDLIAISGTDDQGPCIGMFGVSAGQLRARVVASALQKRLSLSHDGKQLVFTKLAKVNPPDVNFVPTGIFGVDSGTLQDFPDTNDSLVCKYLPPSNRMVTGDLDDHDLVLLDSLSMQVIKSLLTASEIHCLHFDQESQILLVGQTSTLSCYAPDLSIELWSSSSPVPIFAIEVSRDHRIAVCLCEDGRIRLWDLASHELLYELPYVTLHIDRERRSYWLSMPDRDHLIFGEADRSEMVYFPARSPTR